MHVITRAGYAYKAVIRVIESVFTNPMSRFCWDEAEYSHKLIIYLLLHIYIYISLIYTRSTETIILTGCIHLTIYYTIPD